MDKNIEVGVQLTGSAIQELSVWFDTFWAKAQPLDVTQLSKWEQQTAALRREYLELRKKATAEPTLPNEASTSGESLDDLRELLDNAKRFFFCNTDRRQRERDVLERQMYMRGYAAAWEPFNYPSHLDEVEPGDAIFMFAKDVGIIGIGRAKARRQKLEPGDADRIRNFDYEENTPEWRVPVDWLEWRDDGDACLRKGLMGTFLNVSGDRHSGLREAVRRHFLGGKEQGVASLFG